MKKQFLFCLLLLFPASLYAQITINGTSYATLSEAIGASVSGDVIEIAGTVSLEEQVGLAHASGIRTFRGTTPGARITLADGARFVLEAAGETVFENLTLVGAELENEDWGAMFTLFNGPTLILRSDTLRGAKSLAHAGAIRVTSGATLEAYNTVFMENESSQNGGVAFIETNNTTTIFEGCVFMNNKCGVFNPDAKGGALFYAQGANEGEQILENCAFIQNESENHGGAIGLETVSPQVINCTFSENSAFDNGGAIWMWNGAGESTTTLVNCTFVGNTAANGGALFLNQAESQYNVMNSVFVDNGDAPIATGTAPATISVRNSYYAPLMEGLTEATGATTNLHTGDVHLADIDPAAGVVWYDITSEQSVLVGLGSAALLKPYSKKDQIGRDRDLNAPSITAGAIEYTDTPTALSDRYQSIQHRIYPNPTTDCLVLNATEPGEVAIYSLTGRLMARQEMVRGENRIATSHLTQSVYIIKSTSREGIGYARFVKQ
ncbi:Por secretion system C-terminal sorting domain-containing protein [Catalinimonas alkaloidigena]|uniref:Por secretion system C-terminal sorting domain-containing protein n=1 Tax=Catalinimonas alkaloidigena TaxID=1075417 RepID=A0A1G9TP01_9BACT|nr:T9SS type A sorting domain-containing protein [Catalinimonas alkaloidigena]SDM49154.1 Por secretion system C-terminal sorting domain-containing protein [Catalinimonas alkaloidigena]